MRRIGLALVLLLVAGPAAAQERTDAQKKMLTDLAGVLGRAHALRQVCEGPQDLFWRTRFMRLVDTELPDVDFESALTQAFNKGFAQARDRSPACTPQSRQALAAVAAEGRALAAPLSQVTHRLDPYAVPLDDAPDPMAEEPEAR